MATLINPELTWEFSSECGSGVKIVKTIPPQRTVKVKLSRSQRGVESLGGKVAFSPRSDVKSVTLSESVLVAIENGS